MQMIVEPLNIGLFRDLSLVESSLSSFSEALANCIGFIPE